MPRTLSSLSSRSGSQVSSGSFPFGLCHRSRSPGCSGRDREWRDGRRGALPAGTPPGGSGLGLRRSPRQALPCRVGDSSGLSGPGGFLTEKLKAVLEHGLQTELSEQLGYDKLDPAGAGGRGRRLRRRRLSLPWRSRILLAGQVQKRLVAPNGLRATSYIAVVYPRPFLMAMISSPLPVSPDSSQKNEPARPWFLA